MNKLGNSGRIAVVFGTLVLGTVGILGGTAFADRGNVKTTELGATNNGQDPHLESACVGLNFSGFGDTPTVTFQLVAPTAAGDPVAVLPSGNGGYNVADIIAASGVAPAAQGYHVRVDAGGKTKVFWVSTGAEGCPGGPGIF